MLERHSIWKIALVTIAALFLIVTALTPWILKQIINKKLSEIPDVTARVERVVLLPLKLGIQLEDASILANDQRFRIQLPQSAFYLDASELLRFRIAVSAHVLGPSAIFKEPVRAAAEGKLPTQAQARSRSAKLYGTGLRLRELIPAVLQSLSVEDGNIDVLYNGDRYRVSSLGITLANVATRPSRQDGPGELVVRAILPGNGRLQAHGAFDPLDPWPDAKLEFQIEQMHLAAFNPILRDVANVDIEAGTLALVGELVTTKGLVEGYVKPLIQNLDVAGERERDGVQKKVWEHFVQGISSVLKSRKSNKVAAKLEFNGDLNNQDLDFWQVATSVLRNAFGRALSADYDRSVDLQPSLPR